MAEVVPDVVTKRHSLQHVLRDERVPTTLDLPAVVDDIAGRDPAGLTRREFNDDAIARHTRPGEGMFIAALRRHLGRQGVGVPFHEYEMIAVSSERRHGGGTRHEEDRHGAEHPVPGSSAS